MNGRDQFSFYRYPAIAILDIVPLDCSPRGTVSDLFLANVCMGCEDVIEGSTIDVLRMRRKEVADRRRKIDIGAVLVKKYRIRLLLANARILKALLPDDRPATAFPTGTRLSAYCVLGRLHREVRPNFRYLRRRGRAR